MIPLLNRIDVAFESFQSQFPDESQALLPFEVVYEKEEKLIVKSGYSSVMSDPSLVTFSVVHVPLVRFSNIIFLGSSGAGSLPQEITDTMNSMVAMIFICFVFIGFKGFIQNL